MTNDDLHEPHKSGPPVMPHRETAQVTLQIEGLLKRSTFQSEVPDPLNEAMGDVLHWIWSTCLQIRRLRQSLRAEFQAWGDGGRLQKRRAFSSTSYDEHLLFIAAANLDRAIAGAPKTIRREAQLPKSTRRALSLLRNVYEHWDELRRQYRMGTANLRGAARKLKDEFPTADPWSFSFDPRNGDIILADVVALKPLFQQLRLLEASLLRHERRLRRKRKGQEV